MPPKIAFHATLEALALSQNIELTQRAQAAITRFRRLAAALVSASAKNLATQFVAVAQREEPCCCGAVAETDYALAVFVSDLGHKTR